MRHTNLEYNPTLTLPERLLTAMNSLCEQLFIQTVAGLGNRKLVVIEKDVKIIFWNGLTG